MREPAEGVTAVIDDFDRLDSLQRAAYRVCERDFDCTHGGRTLFNVMWEAGGRPRTTNWKLIRRIRYI
jgi:hypothetical protein